MSRAVTAVTALLPGVRLLLRCCCGGDTGLFCGDIGLFGRMIGLFCGIYTGCKEDCNVNLSLSLGSCLSLLPFFWAGKPGRCGLLPPYR